MRIPGKRIFINELESGMWYSQIPIRFFLLQLKIGIARKFDKRKKEFIKFRSEQMLTHYASGDIVSIETKTYQLGRKIKRRHRDEEGIHKCTGFDWTYTVS